MTCMLKMMMSWLTSFSRNTANVREGGGSVEF